MNKFKRNYNVIVSCSGCKKISVVSDKAISYICHFCNVYNSVKEAVERFDNKDFIDEPNNSSDVQFPNVRMESDGARDYMKFRDEYEIRADMFAKGKTRKSMGIDKFSNELRRELVRNKCYRGLENSGV